MCDPGERRDGRWRLGARVHVVGARRSRVIVGFGDSRDARAYSGMPACGVDVYLNGLRIVGNLDGIRSSDLAGVEYYQAGAAPEKYRRPMAACPVLLLWPNR